MSLHRKFVKWFYDDVYAEPNHNRNGWMRDYADHSNPDHRNFWMRESFLAGAVEGRALSIWLLKQEWRYHLNEGNMDIAATLEECIFKLQNTADYPKNHE